MSSMMRYLNYAVHGITEHERRKPRRRAGRRGPSRDWKYRAWIRKLPCAFCGTDAGVEAAHTGSDGGMRQKSSDYSCVPLCHDCHQSAPISYHRLGRDQFAAQTGIDFADLVSRLNVLWHEMRDRTRGETL